MNINEIKKDFPLLENRDIAYLDSGATTQKPVQVIKAVEEFYEKNNANPHRGAYTLSIEATEEYENARTKIAEFINAKHREEIIFSKKLEDVNLSVCFLHPKHKADLTLPLVTCHVPKDSIPPWVEFEDIQYG